MGRNKTLTTIIGCFLLILLILIAGMIMASRKSDYENALLELEIATSDYIRENPYILVSLSNEGDIASVTVSELVEAGLLGKDAKGDIVVVPFSSNDIICILNDGEDKFSIHYSGQDKFNCNTLVKDSKNDEFASDPKDDEDPKPEPKDPTPTPKPEPAPDPKPEPEPTPTPEPEPEPTPTPEPTPIPSPPPVPDPIPIQKTVIWYSPHPDDENLTNIKFSSSKRLNRYCKRMQAKNRICNPLISFGTDSINRHNIRASRYIKDISSLYSGYIEEVKSGYIIAKLSRKAMKIFKGSEHQNKLR